MQHQNIDTTHQLVNQLVKITITNITLRSDAFAVNDRGEAVYISGKIDENIVQHLARGVIADNALTVQKLTGYNPALTVHDELVYVAPEDEAERLLGTVQKVMRTPPVWWPELVTWSEGDISDTYDGAK